MNIPDTRTSDFSLNHFVSLMDRYEGFIALAGKKVRRASPAVTESIFRLATIEHQRRMINRLESEIAIFEDTLGAAEALENAPRQLWRYLLKRRLVPCSDLFDKIGEKDTIQVYGMDLRMLFASLNFFDRVSFTLEQIFNETWQTAVARDEQYSQLLLKDFKLLFSGELRHSVQPRTPAHLIEEVDTEGMLKSHLHVKWMSPAFLDEKVECGIFIVKVDNL